MQHDDEGRDRAKSVLRLARPSPAAGRDGNGVASARSAAAADDGRPATRVVAFASAVESHLRSWSAEIPEWLVPIRVSSGSTLRSLLSTLHPSVIFLDLALPELGGVRAIGPLASASPASRIVVVSRHPSDGETLAAARSGAWGYTTPALDGATISRITEAVLRDEHWVPRRVMSGLLLDGAGPVTRPIAGPLRVARTPSLSPREEEIAHLVLAGVSNKEIASQLAITEATVKAHLTVVFRKLGVTSRLQLGLLLARKDRGVAVS